MRSKRDGASEGRPDGLARPTVVVIQHHPRDPLGLLAPILSAEANLLFVRGYEDQERATETVKSLAASGNYQAVIGLGGPMGVYERDASPILYDSLRLMEDALRRNIPILGLCLSAQLLAHVAGAAVYPGATKGYLPEVGYRRLILTDEADADPVMKIYGTSEPVLFWHRDTCDLPVGATLLAATDQYPVAAFRLGSRAYGIQFHLETSARQMKVWTSQSALAHIAGVDSKRLVEESNRRDPLARRKADELAGLLLCWARAGCTPATAR